jgi:outer membrane protein assembly factor BamB
MPTTWSQTNNVVWRVPILGLGQSSPVISGDHIYVTSSRLTADNRQLLIKAALSDLRLVLALAVGFTLLLVAGLELAHRSQRFSGQAIVFGLSALAILVAMGTVGYVVVTHHLFSAVQWYRVVPLDMHVRHPQLLFGCLALACALVIPSRWFSSILLAGASVFLLISKVKPEDGPYLRRVMLAFGAFLLFCSLLSLFRNGGLRLTGSINPGTGEERSRPSVVPGLILVCGAFLAISAAVGFIGLRPAPERSIGIVESQLFAKYPQSRIASYVIAAFITCAFVRLFLLLAGPRRALAAHGFWTCWLPSLAAIGLVITELADDRYEPRSNIQRALYCHSLESGKRVWDWAGLVGPWEGRSTISSSATPTPVVYRDHVFAYLGTSGLVCLNVYGQCVWTNTCLPTSNLYGASSSLIADDGKIFVMADGKSNACVFAVDAERGSILWRNQRSSAPDGLNGGTRTPVIREIGGRKVLIIWGCGDLSGYDLGTGREAFRTPCSVDKIGFPAADHVTSLVATERELFLAEDGKAYRVSLDSLASKGLGAAKWVTKLCGPTLPSPILCGGRLYVIADSGELTCLDAANGRVLFSKKLPGRYFASPIAAEGLIYISNDRGQTTVIKASDRFESVTTNVLPEPIWASFAPSEGKLVIRTENSLWCIGETN